MPTASALLNSVREKVGGDGAAWHRLTVLAAQMDASGRDRDDPIREVFGLLGDRWTMLILLALEAGSWRHATLKKIIGALSIEGAISQRMLTMKLRALERDGFVIRDISDHVPPRVDYRLSTSGARLLAHASDLLAWLQSERAAIDDARYRYDARDA